MLKSTFCRVREGTESSRCLLSLAHFLDARGLLTDGGRLSLASGLRGRGGVLSLTTQDVRSSAHGLARDLWEVREPARWASIAESYYERYDRGKPRRPTRLQRLMMAWSPDLGPLGLLEACATHPRLWSELELALRLGSSEDHEAGLLATALAVRQCHDWTPWLTRLENRNGCPSELLELLPLLPHPAETVRLAWLSEQSWLPAPARLLACRRRVFAPSVMMPQALREMTCGLIQSSRGAVEARWLGVLRGYRWPAAEVSRLGASLDPQDPVHRIVFGPRPGRSWLAELLLDLASPRPDGGMRSSN